MVVPELEEPEATVREKSATIWARAGALAGALTVSPE
jgi:hypothetical protein